MSLLSTRKAKEISTFISLSEKIRFSFICIQFENDFMMAGFLECEVHEYTGQLNLNRKDNYQHTQRICCNVKVSQARNWYPGALDKSCLQV